jgi:hypothetical protein
VQDLIEYIVRNLVEDPEAVRVREVAGEQTGIYEVQVAPADQGKVIGKQGRTIRSIRSLVTAAASRSGKRAVVEVLD